MTLWKQVALTVHLVAQNLVKPDAEMPWSLSMKAVKQEKENFFQNYRGGLKSPQPPPALRSLVLIHKLELLRIFQLFSKALLAVSGFLRAPLSFSHAQKRRALGSSSTSDDRNWNQYSLWSVILYMYM